MRSIAYMMGAVMCVLVIGAGWGFYFFLSSTNKSTMKCSQKYTCNDNHEGGGLPGGEQDPRYSHTPWSIGGRDCAWFEVDQDNGKNRCKLPVKSKKGEPDLCFDVAYWKDKKGDDCIWWTRWVTGDKTKLWSPFVNGTDDKCITSPPGKNMSKSDMDIMKSACCVCGGGRSQRDYAGPTSNMYKNWPKPPHPLLPIQHTGKTATHLTQCCVCNDEAVRQALVGKSGNRKTRIEEGLQIDGNPRGGVLRCEGTESTAWDSWKEQDEPYIIVAAIATFVLFVVAVICCYYFFKEEPEKTDPAYATVGPDSDSP